MLAASQQKMCVYPESDGKPMGETDLHRDLIIEMIELLQNAFPDAYVSGNICLYYELNNPKKMISPDGLLCLRQSPHQKRVYLAWEENAQLDLVAEFSSWSTKREDHHKKKQIYQHILKVPYYLIYDPQAQYLNVFELQAGVYRLLEADLYGRWQLSGLGLQLAHAEDAGLKLYYKDGRPVLRWHQRAEQETQRAQQEAQRAEQEAQRAEQAEEQNRQLQEKLRLMEAQLKDLR